MEKDKTCKVCGVEKPIYEFGKKDKFKYRTECKVCYNQMRRDFNKLSVDEKLKIKEEIKLREEKRLLESKKKREIEKLEKESNKKLKDKNLIMEYELRMKDKMEKRKIRLKNYICGECGETNMGNFYPKRKNRCKKCILSTPSNQSYSNMSVDKKKKYIEKNREWVGENIIKVRLSAAKHRSIRKNIPFEINEEVIQQKLNEQDGKCYISKKQLVLKENDWYGLSLDRLDSNLGYTIDNTILVTKFVNTSKNSLSYDDYVRLLKEVCENISGTN
jgi:hypothetical protein